MEPSRILIGDCLAILPTLEPESVDAIVTDPPYGLHFMSRDWDHGIPGVHFWEAALRVAKPGAHLVAFGGTRTHHRLMCAIEDAGWEIRDCLGWLYGSGFPKSLDVSKAIDKAAGAERKIITTIRKTPSAASENMNEGWRRPWAENHSKTMDITSPATETARQWQGYGTALKPAWEPIILARKPLAGTVADNVLRHGCGALNVDGCRIPIDLGDAQTSKDFRTSPAGKHMPFGDGSPGHYHPSGERRVVHRNHPLSLRHCEHGRWPANIVHDGSPDVMACFPLTEPSNARFFYTAKASKADRDEGLESYEPVKGHSNYGTIQEFSHNPPRRNHHPTVKPTSLMRWLVRLVTPPGGLILDPFAGSGSTGKAAILERFRFLGIEQDPEYAAIAKARIAHALAQAPLSLADPT